VPYLWALPRSSSEYAPDNRLTRIIRISIINLAGIPSVVYGLFGLGISWSLRPARASWLPINLGHHDTAGDYQHF
jgi:ABC-type phosphate transport system permease subunit